MGTRSLIAVSKGNEYKVAQYCQWDGYLTGQGHDILEFFRENDLETFREKVDNCFFGTKEQIEEAYAPFVNEHGMMTMDQYDLFGLSPNGHLSRDTGSNILNVIMKSKGPLMLQNRIDFAKDSLFCEFAYVIDLNRNVLEIYKGFNKEPLDPSERFFSEEEYDEYGPVKFVKEYSLFDLPENFNDLEKEMDEGGE